MNLTKFGVMLILVLAVSVGYVLGIFFQHDLMVINNEIDVLSGLSILSSLFVLIYLSILFEKAREGDRIKKEIVLRRCAKLEESIDSLRDTINRKSIDVSELTFMLKALSADYYSVVDFINSAEYSLETFENDFIASQKRLRAISTYYKKSTGGNSAISISNNLVTYSSFRKTKIRAELANVEKLIIKLELDIAVQ